MLSMHVQLETVALLHFSVLILHPAKHLPGSDMYAGVHMLFVHDAHNYELGYAAGHECLPAWFCVCLCLITLTLSELGWIVLCFCGVFALWPVCPFPLYLLSLLFCCCTAQTERNYCTGKFIISFFFIVLHWFIYFYKISVAINGSRT